MERHCRVENEDAEDRSQHMNEQMEDAIGWEEGLHNVDTKAEGRGDRNEELINVRAGEDAEDGSTKKQDASGKNDKRTDEAWDEGRAIVTIRSPV